KFTWTRTVAPGGRIKEVLVEENGAWVPIDPEKVYGVVSNNFMRAGGDGYQVFTTAMNAYDFGPGLEAVVADYLAQSNGYQPYTDGRVKEE
ncbi:MAG TPA: 5'-nucleotidase C-terminal domain-containing protein, partial [Paracoccaceae bacterium]|nr:5'-nucleotidase C-terminal domain-containing protein [Paracoccaceae bacterium]